MSDEKPSPRAARDHLHLMAFRGGYCVPLCGGPPDGGWLTETVGDVKCQACKALAAAAPRMRDLLRGAADWYCGEMPDGADRREAIRTLLRELGELP